MVNHANRIIKRSSLIIISFMLMFTISTLPLRSAFAQEGKGIDCTTFEQWNALNDERAFFNPCADTCSGDAGVKLSAALSKNIPEDWGMIFSAAAEKFNINPNVLAALYLTENGNTWKPLDSDWPVSYAGANGPMQFLMPTWEAHKQDGDGDGVMDVNNVHDAMFGAAHFITSMGLHKDSPIGDINNPWSQSDSILYIAGSYNAGPGTISGVAPNGRLTDVSQEAQNYVKNFEALFSSDFTKAGHPNYPDPAPDGEAGDVKSSANTGCKSGNGGIIEGGMTLEQATEFMDTYINSSDSVSFVGGASACTGSNPTIAQLANCVSFSNYFMNKYTSIPSVNGNGAEIVPNIIATHGSAVKTGSDPQPYAVFSYTASNHTGVILGVDTSRGVVIIGEANCGQGDAGIRAVERPLSEMESQSTIYAYMEPHLKGGL